MKSPNSIALLIFLVTTLAVTKLKAWPTFVAPIAGRACAQVSTDCGFNCRCCGCDDSGAVSGCGTFCGGAPDGVHTGVDIAASQGTRVVAPFAGIVRRAAWNNGYGGTVVIESEDGTASVLLGHLLCDPECEDPASAECRALPPHSSGGTTSRCRALAVAVGDRVRTGCSDDALAGCLVGQIGPRSTQQNGGFPPHLHFTLRYGGYTEARSTEREVCVAADGTRTVHASAWKFRGYTCAMDALCSFASPQAAMGGQCTMSGCRADESCNESDDRTDRNAVVDDGLGEQTCAASGGGAWSPLCVNSTVRARRLACLGVCSGDCELTAADRIRTRYNALPEPRGAVPCDNGGGAGAHLWQGVTLQDYCDSLACPADTTSWAIVDNPSIDTPRASVVRSGFWGTYKCMRTVAREGLPAGPGGPTLLGAPRGEEYDPDGDGVVVSRQDFDRGHLWWGPDEALAVPRIHVHLDVDNDLLDRGATSDCFGTTVVENPPGPSSCRHECAAGQQSCVGDTGRVYCGAGFDADPCLEMGRADRPDQIQRCADGTVCRAGSCVSCSLAGQPCCASGACAATLVCGADRTCIPCGDLEEPCCASGAPCTGSLVCAIGRCRAPVSTSDAGASGADAGARSDGGLDASDAGIGVVPRDAGLDTTTPTQDRGIPQDLPLDVPPRIDAGLGPCPPPSVRCGGACTDLQGSTANCGACGRVCALSNASPACAGGRCLVAACASGFGNCDGDSANGCERSLTNDNSHCGGCGVACPSGQSCQGTRCVDACAGRTCPPCQSCSGGTCVAVPDGTACADEGNTCTLDRCAGGRCDHPRRTDDCGGRSCGLSACGNACGGSCPSGQVCNASGQCVSTCGDGACVAGETPFNCVPDCGPVDQNLRPALYYQNTTSPSSLTCSSVGSTAWHTGTSGDLPFWVFASNCGVPAAGSPTSYAGYNARWTFTVRRSGAYRLDAWVPNSSNACGFDGTRFSTSVHYLLGGPVALRRDLSQQGAMGTGVVLWDEAPLTPGTYTVYLYDDAAGGCRCNTVSTCTGPTSTRVWADGVGVHFQHE